MSASCSRRLCAEDVGLLLSKRSVHLFGQIVKLDQCRSNTKLQALAFAARVNRPCGTGEVGAQQVAWVGQQMGSPYRKAW